MTKTMLYIFGPLILLLIYALWKPESKEAPAPAPSPSEASVVAPE